MRLRDRILTTMAVAFLLAPTLLLGADDAAKPAATVKKDGAVHAHVAPGVVTKAKPAAAPEAGSGSTKSSSKSTDIYVPRFDLFVGYSNFREWSAGGNRIGWLSGGSTSLAVNLNRYFGLVGDFGGYGANSFGPGAPPIGAQVNASGTVFTYMFGPRLSLRHERFTPFAQALFGGVHASNVTLNGCSGIGCVPLPSENSFTMTAGAGLDITLTRHVVFRLIQAEYVLTDFRNPYLLAAPTQRQNDMRLSTGLVFRFGGGHRPSHLRRHLHRRLRRPWPRVRPIKHRSLPDRETVVTVHAQASSPDNSPLTYTWAATGGAVAGSGPDVQWNSSGVAPGTYTVRARVDNGRGGTVECSAAVRVEPPPNHPPTMSCSADRHSVTVGEHVQINATASDPDNDPLTYTWCTTGGQIIGSGASVSFDSSGLAPGRSTVTGQVDDGRGGTADCTVDFDVQVAQATPAQPQLEARLALHSIYFPTAQPAADHPEGGLTESQRTILIALAGDFKKYLELKPDAHLILEGHADPRGSVEYNNALTERRVARSKSFLVEQGVPAASIETRSLGKQHLLTAAQVREQMESNPDLTAEDRRRLHGRRF